MTTTEALEKAVEVVSKGNGLVIKGRLYLPIDLALERLNRWDVYYILFDADFCKALFGEEEVCEECGSEYKDSKFGGYCTAKTCVDNPLSQKAWQYHLQMMVLYEDPLDYLVEYLGKEKA